MITVKDIAEAIEVANSTPYALTGGIFSRSPENIARVRREFRVGNLYINRGITGAVVGRHPFGGFRMSGVGSKSGSPEYLLQFMVQRNVVENTMRRGFAPAVEEIVQAIRISCDNETWHPEHTGRNEIDRMAAGIIFQLFPSFLPCIFECSR